MLPPGRMSTITGSLQVYAFVSISIVCVLTTQTSASNYTVNNRNESGEIQTRKTVHPKEAEIGQVEATGRSLKHRHNVIDSHHSDSNQVHGYERRGEVYTAYVPAQSPNYSFNRRSYNAYQYNKSPQALAQDRYHPTTYEEPVEGEGEVREVPLTSDQQTSFDSVQSGSDQNFAQDSYVQAAFNQDSVPQGSESFQSDSVPADSYSDPQITPYNYQPPSGGYDYHPPPPPPPPPAPTKGYYYLPPPPPPPPTKGYYYLPPPSNKYLPDPPPEPEETRQTTDYTYYYLGPKLWYIPLFFSVYFVLYVAALIIKAITKHKILFPQQMFNAATSVLQARSDNLNQALNIVTTALTEASKNYNKRTRELILPETIKRIQDKNISRDSNDNSYTVSSYHLVSDGDEQNRYNSIIIGSHMADSLGNNQSNNLTDVSKYDYSLQKQRSHSKSYPQDRTTASASSPSDSEVKPSDQSLYVSYYPQIVPDNSGNLQKKSNIYAQDRFHPTTYEESDGGKYFHDSGGNSESVIQDSHDYEVLPSVEIVQSGSHPDLLQDSYLQASLNQDNYSQGTDAVNTQTDKAPIEGTKPENTAYNSQSSSTGENDQPPPADENNDIAPPPLPHSPPLSSGGYDYKLPNTNGHEYKPPSPSPTKGYDYTSPLLPPVIGYEYAQPTPLRPTKGYDYKPPLPPPTEGYNYKPPPPSPSIGYDYKPPPPPPTSGYDYKPPPLPLSVGYDYKPPPPPPTAGYDYKPPPPPPSVGYDYKPPPPPPSVGYDYKPPPPPPSIGYDYKPPPPPPPKPTEGYFYLPPPQPQQYLPLPPPPKQYLPLPPPPKQYLPLPPPPQPEPPEYATYHLGTKLWYLPLFFSAYFALYVIWLIAVALLRHRISFIQNLFNAANGVFSAQRRNGEDNLNQLLNTVASAIKTAGKKYS